MVLRVEPAEFKKVVREQLGEVTVFLAELGSKLVLSAGKPERNLQIFALVPQRGEELASWLKAEGITTHPGGWVEVEKAVSEDLANTYVAAVAYKSRESSPGVWVDAFPNKPTSAEVLRMFHGELVAGAESPDIGFDEFCRMADPTVVIVSPAEIRGFRDEKN